MSDTTYIVPRAMIDGTGAPARHNIAVGFTDDRITYVGPSDDIPQDGHAAIVSEPALTLLPGLVDSHVHLTLMDQSTKRMVPGHADEIKRTGIGKHNALSVLAGGVTTVRDCGDVAFVGLAVREAVAGGWSIGPRILVSGAVITTSALPGDVASWHVDDHLTLRGVEADTEEDLVSAVRAHDVYGADWIMLVGRYGTDTLAAAVDETHTRGRRLAAYVRSSQAVRDAVDAGVDVVEHRGWRDVGYDERLAAKLAERGTHVVVLPSEQDRRLLTNARAGRPGALRALRSHYADARMLTRAGAQILSGSDAGISGTRVEDFAESLICNAVGLGLSPVAAIHRATAVPAQALGVGEEVGTIEEGKQADMILVAGDPAIDIDDIGHVVRVWRGGQLVVDRALPQ
jgi:imidazolonepropionase-like amidohydrolase